MLEWNWPTSCSFNAFVVVGNGVTNLMKLIAFYNCYKSNWLINWNFLTFILFLETYHDLLFHSLLHIVIRRRRHTQGVLWASHVSIVKKCCNFKFSCNKLFEVWVNYINKYMTFFSKDKNRILQMVKIKNEQDCYVSKTMDYGEPLHGST